MRFFQMLAHGTVKKPGITKEQAKEYISENTGSKAYSKLKERLTSKKSTKKKSNQ